MKVSFFLIRKRECWVEEGCDVIQSNNATFDGIIFSKASIDKKHATKDKTWSSHSSSAYLSRLVCLDVLIGWRHILPRPNSLLNSAIFELRNGGQSFWEFVVKKVGQNHGLNFGMVGTYRTYFRNVKRKDKVIFDHSTTLTFCAENRRAPAKKCIHLRMPGVWPLYY